jgi:hypothetical protein
MSSSSELSDLIVSEQQRRVLPPTDPFPLDHGLQRRVDELLDRVNLPEAAELHERPRFRHPPDYELPRPSVYVGTVTNESTRVSKSTAAVQVSVVESSVKDPSVQERGDGPSFKFGSGLERGNDGARSDVPDWRPRLVSSQGTKVIGVQEMPVSEGRGLSGKGDFRSRKKVTLKEIGIND